MRERFASLSMTQKLGLLAFLLGLLALFLGSPYQGNRAVVDAKEIAISIDRAEDHVTAQELAESLIAQDWEYRLIDVRSAEEYAEYHIPTAEHVTVPELPAYPLLRKMPKIETPMPIHPLPRQKKAREGC